MNGAERLTLDAQAERLAEALRMALTIADETCISDVEAYGRACLDGWVDIAPRDGDDPFEAKSRTRAAKYLSLRGHVEIDPTDPQRVRVKT